MLIHKRTAKPPRKRVTLDETHSGFEHVDPPSRQDRERAQRRRDAAWGQRRTRGNQR